MGPDTMDRNPLHIHIEWKNSLSCYFSHFCHLFYLWVNLEKVLAGYGNAWQHWSFKTSSWCFQGNEKVKFFFVVAEKTFVPNPTETETHKTFNRKRNFRRFISKSIFCPKIFPRKIEQLWREKKVWSFFVHSSTICHCGLISFKPAENCISNVKLVPRTQENSWAISKARCFQCEANLSKHSSVKSCWRWKWFYSSKN